MKLKSLSTYSKSYVAFLKTKVEGKIESKVDDFNPQRDLVVNKIQKPRHNNTVSLRRPNRELTEKGSSSNLGASRRESKISIESFNRKSFDKEDPSPHNSILRNRSETPKIRKQNHINFKQEVDIEFENRLKSKRNLMDSLNTLVGNVKPIQETTEREETNKSLVNKEESLHDKDINEEIYKETNTEAKAKTNKETNTETNEEVIKDKDLIQEQEEVTEKKEETKPKVVPIKKISLVFDD